MSQSLCVLGRSGPVPFIHLRASASLVPHSAGQTTPTRTQQQRASENNERAGAVHPGQLMSSHDMFGNDYLASLRSSCFYSVLVAESGSGVWSCSVVPESGEAGRRSIRLCLQRRQQVRESSAHILIVTDKKNHDHDPQQQRLQILSLPLWRINQFITDDNKGLVLSLDINCGVSTSVEDKWAAGGSEGDSYEN